MGKSFFGGFFPPELPRHPTPDTLVLTTAAVYRYSSTRIRV